MARPLAAWVLVPRAGLHSGREHERLCQHLRDAALDLKAARREATHHAQQIEVEAAVKLVQHDQVFTQVAVNPNAVAAVDGIPQKTHAVEMHARARLARAGGAVVKDQSR